MVQHGFLRFIIETDSQRVVRLLCGISDDISEVGMLVQLIRDDSLAGTFMGVFHTRRDGNQPAHVLAQLAMVSDSVQSWVGACPSQISSLVFLDCHV